MTVAELIEALELKDPAAQVVLEGPYGGFTDGVRLRTLPLVLNVNTDTDFGPHDLAQSPGSADISAIALLRNPPQQSNFELNPRDEQRRALYERHIMKIGIIGIGNIGGLLARQLSAKGHLVKVANSKGAEAVKAFAQEIGATAADVQGAVEDVDLIVVSIPFHRTADLPKGLLDGVSASVPVVDTGNYYPGMLSPQISEVDGGLVESEWTAKQLGRPVIKAFNAIGAISLAEGARPAGASDRVAIPVAGDDLAQKQIVMDLVAELGFDPVDAGPLKESWRQQPATPAYCCDFDVKGVREGLASAVKGEAPRRLARFGELLGTLPQNPVRADFVALSRKLGSLPL